MASILYEHPLNERIRCYLRLEHLFNQLNACIDYPIKASHQVYFNALFAILDMLERNDVRGDLIKDLEKLEQNLVLWSQSPDIDVDVLEPTLRQTISLSCHLKSNQQKWWQLKQDKFLAGLKQRFAIQGGSACFDLPQLHFWLNQAHAQQDTKAWLTPLEHISHTLILILKFIRQKSSFEQIEAPSGFYQENGEGLSLLRIKVDDAEQYYPSVSGNRLRYSIRFMSPCAESGKRYISEPTRFQLARC